MPQRMNPRPMKRANASGALFRRRIIGVSRSRRRTHRLRAAGMTRTLAGVESDALRRTPGAAVWPDGIGAGVDRSAAARRVERSGRGGPLGAGAANRGCSWMTAVGVIGFIQLIYHAVEFAAAEVGATCRTSVGEYRNPTQARGPPEHVNLTLWVECAGRTESAANFLAYHCLIGLLASFPWDCHAPKAGKCPTFFLMGCREVGTSGAIGDLSAPRLGWSGGRIYACSECFRGNVSASSGRLRCR